jgi:hypothetical protein
MQISVNLANLGLLWVGQLLDFQNAVTTCIALLNTVEVCQLEQQRAGPCSRKIFSFPIALQSAAVVHAFKACNQIFPSG